LNHRPDRMPRAVIRCGRKALAPVLAEFFAG
jgi:hypothetical protein